jgi:flagella basal body P-ring formation protein FlgA
LLPKIFLLLFCLPFLLHAQIYLKSNYYVNTNNVSLYDITGNKEHNKKLFDIPEYRHTLRLPAKKVLHKLASLGYKKYASKHSYIQFSKKSPINTKKIISAVKNYYKKSYKEIEINSIEVAPRAYIESLPNSYTIIFQKRAYLHNSSTLFLKTTQGKKIFFHYTINAKIKLYETTKKVQKGQELTELNSKKKSIILQKFRAKPIQELQAGTYEAKHRLEEGKVITQRDVLPLIMIRRGDEVTVTLREHGIVILFRARALQNGRIGDTIRIEQKNKKRLQAIVSGKNRAIIK